METVFRTAFTLLRSFFLFLAITTLSAQPAVITVSGRVLDQKTGEPLAGAEIYLTSKQAGTVSDRDGKFSLQVPLRLVKTDTLAVSFIGYRKALFPLKEFRSPATIRLRPAALTLNQMITITGERGRLKNQEIPHLVRTVSAEQLDRLGKQELVQVLKNVPAVNVAGNLLDGHRVEIRGSQSSEVNVYLDGVLLNGFDPQGAADLSLVPPDAIERLEIVKGGNLPLWGQGSFGGAVNIITRQSGRPELRVKAGAGDFNSRFVTGYANLPLFSRLQISYSGYLKRFRPQIEFFPDEQFSAKTRNYHIDIERQSHYLGLNYLSPFGLVKLTGFRYALDYRKPSWNDRRLNRILAFQFHTPNQFSLFVNQGFLDDETRRTTSLNSVYGWRLKTEQLNVRLLKKTDFRRVGWQFGAEYFHEQTDSRAYLSDSLGNHPYLHSLLYDNRAALISVFRFEDYLRPDDRNLFWRVYLSGRVDVSASGYRDFTQSVGIRVHRKQGRTEFVPYFNYGKNVKYPTPREQARLNNLVAAFPGDTLRRSLRPEYNTSAEAGFKWNYDLASLWLNRVEASAAVFLSITTNKIVRQPLGQEFFQTQTGRNTTTGLEAALRLKRIYQWLDLELSGLALDIDNPLLYPYKPRQRVNLGLDFHPGQSFYLTTRLFYEGSAKAWYFDLARQLRSAQIKSHYDLDLAAGFSLPIQSITLGLQLSGNNILDRSSYAYYYIYKRYWQLSLTLRY